MAEPGATDTTASPAPTGVPSYMQPATSPAAPRGPEPVAPDIAADTAPPSVTSPDVMPAAATPVAPTQQTVTIQHRGGLAGLIDEFRNALAGTTTTQIQTDAQGNKTIVPVKLTPGQQWMRIAATAAHGAAAGYAGGQGVGGQGRAGLAGIQAGEEDVDKRRKLEQDQRAEVRQANLDNYNTVKRKLDLATSTLELKRKGAEADEHEIKFSQDQLAYEKNLGSADLGIIPDFAHPAAAAKSDPDFFKHLYTDHTIVGVPEVGADGKRIGVHVFLRTTKPGEDIVPAGTEIHAYNAPTKPGEKPSITTQKTAGPMKRSDFDAQNNDAITRYHTWTSEDQKEQLTAAQITEAQKSAKVKDSEVTLNIAKANEANATARKLKIEAEQSEGTGAGDPNTQAQMLVDGRLAPSQLNKRAKNYDNVMRMADQLSMQQTGQHYDPAMGEVRYQNYKRVGEAYANGKEAEQIMSFDRFLGHALETSQMVNNARNTNLPWLNKPLNKIEKLTGSQKSPEVIAYQQSLETTRREYQNFLNAGHVIDKADKEKMDHIMDDSANPAQVQEGLKTYAKLAVVRLRSLDFGYMRVAGGHVPNLVSPEGEEAFRHFEVDPKTAYTTMTPQRTIPAAGPNVPTGGGGGPAAPTSGPQSSQTMPTGATGTAMGPDKKLHWSDAQGKDYGLVAQ